jgi:flagellin-like hook-associated protein FlgL
VTIRLGSNISALSAQRKLADGTALLSKTFERLSSGQRINKASDDAAGLSIADSLSARSRIYNQGVRNLNDGLSLLSIADSAIENLTDIVIRLEELAEQAANGVYTNKQRKAMDDEAQALSKEYFRISKSTEFNGQSLLGGTFDQINLQAGFGDRSVLSGGVGGAIGTGRFQDRVTAATTGSPMAVTTADFNADGLADIATATGTGTTVHLGTSAGGFILQGSFASGSSNRGITTGDFNGDGTLDIVTANGGGNSISILIGLGNGSFMTSVSYLAGNNVYSVASGDFNGDGIADLVSADQGSNTASVFIGRGDGSFAPRATYGLAGGPQSVVTADFNSDGILDLAFAEFSSHTLDVLLGQGSGIFGTRVSFASGSNPYSVCTGDINQDGHMDLISINSGENQINVLMGLGNGSFQARVSYATGPNPLFGAIGDFNGDGALDIATNNFDLFGPGSASMFLNRGDGTFTQAASYAVGSQPQSIAGGDFNSDGVLDLVAVGSATLRMLFAEIKDGISPLLPFSLRTMADARQVLPVFKRKCDQLAAQRGEIGAFQSRTAVAINVLQVSSETFKAAESRIRDADIADESSRLTRLNILQQAASSVLAQANQQPALALQLLR